MFAKALFVFVAPCLFLQSSELDTYVETLWKGLHAKAPRQEKIDTTAVLMTCEYSIADRCKDLMRKRTADEKIKAEVDKLKKEREGALFFALRIVLLPSEEKYTFDYPGDLQNYVFLENDRGVYIRAKSFKSIDEEDKEDSSLFLVWFATDETPEVKKDVKVADDEKSALVTKKTKALKLIVNPLNDHMQKLEFLFKMPVKYPPRPKVLQSLLGKEHFIDPLLVPREPEKVNKQGIKKEGEDGKGNKMAQVVVDNGAGSHGTLGRKEDEESCDPELTSVARLGDGALHFDGEDDLVSVTCSKKYDNLSALTVEAWIKTGAKSDIAFIFSKRNPSQNTGFELFLTEGKIRFGVNNGKAYSEPKGGNDLRDNQWHHLAATYDKRSGIINLYVDAARVLASNPFTDGNLNSGEQTACIGMRTDGTAPYQGIIDELAIWNRPLSDNEIKERFNSGKGRELRGNESGLLSVWHFNTQEK